jgi:hypothetical protein
MRNSKADLIIEGLKYKSSINEELNEIVNGVIPPNSDNSEPTGTKAGDFIKMLEKVFTSVPSGLYVCVGVHDNKDPNKVSVSYHKLLNDGSLAKMTPANWVAVYKTAVDKLIGENKIKILKPGSTLDEGVVDINVIKDAVKFLGYEKVVGFPINQVVKSSGRYIEIRTKDKNWNPIDIKHIIRLVQNLKAKGFDMSDEEAKIKNDTTSYKSNSILIEKNLK